MTATNHALTGAAIALVAKQPVLALPLAFLSHFVLDSLPHFGIEGDKLKRNRMRLFWWVQAADTLGLAFIFSAAIFWIHAPIKLWVLLLAMVLAWSPDFAWIYRFVLKEKIGKLPPSPMNFFNRFHAGIQHYERRWGIFIEIAWFMAATTVLVKFLI